MNTTLQVRAVRPNDFEAWKPLWDGYNAFYGRLGDTALPDSVTQVTWERFFNPVEPVFALVAERDGRLLGLTHYCFTAAQQESNLFVTSKICSLTKARAVKVSAERLSSRSMNRQGSQARAGCTGKPR
jgi:hypothetical protein